MDAKNFLKNLKDVFLPTKSWKNHLKKLHTYGCWEVFFSAASTAQNSPELHFRFINSFIQSSLLRSLAIIIQFTNSLYRLFCANWFYKKRSKKLTYLVIFMQNRLLFLQLGSEANIRGLYILSGYPLGQGPGFRCPWLGLYCIHNCKLW